MDLPTRESHHRGEIAGFCRDTWRLPRVPRDAVVVEPLDRYGGARNRDARYLGRHAVAFDEPAANRSVPRRKWITRKRIQLNGVQRTVQLRRRQVDALEGRVTGIDQQPVEFGRVLPHPHEEPAVVHDGLSGKPSRGDVDTLCDALECHGIEKLHRKHHLTPVREFERYANREPAAHEEPSGVRPTRDPTFRLSMTTGKPTDAGSLGSIHTGLAMYAIEVR